MALQAADGNKCPICGGPMNECLDPESEGKWEVGAPIRCQRATQVAIRQKQHHDSIPKGVDLNTRALIWGATRKP